jgi:hypothetical protein
LESKPVLFNIAKFQIMLQKTEHIMFDEGFDISALWLMGISKDRTYHV